MAWKPEALIETSWKFGAQPSLIFPISTKVSWLLNTFDLLIGNPIRPSVRVPPDWSSKGASQLVDPECLPIGQSWVPPDWLIQSASWLVKPESLPNGWARRQGTSQLVKLGCLPIGQSRVPPNGSGILLESKAHQSLDLAKLCNIIAIFIHLLSMYYTAWLAKSFEWNFNEAVVVVVVVVGVLFEGKERPSLGLGWAVQFLISHSCHLCVVR